MMDVTQIITKLTELIAEYGLKILGAIAIWFIGAWVIKTLTRAFVKMLKKYNTDPSLLPFLKGIVNVFLKVILVISMLHVLGVELTSLVAILGAVTLAIGLALTGALQNFAGGVLIQIFKPFKVGDVIEAQGFIGTVNSIQIFNTVLKTFDNRTIIIPNGGLSTSSLINYSIEARRRVDWTFGIAYGDDVTKAQKVLQGLCDADSRILKDPKAFIAVNALADSSVNIAVRAWVNTPDYWPVFHQMNEKVYTTFGNEGLNIPFPQMDVHLHGNK
jgi:small conductance mechanosensitive channel